MKYFTLSFCLSLISISFGQIKFANIETFEYGKFPYDTLTTCASLKGHIINCDTYNCTGDLIEIELRYCDPEAEDDQKQISIDSITSDINNLISTAGCKRNSGISFYLQLGEDIFIKKSDKLIGRKLNLARFVKMFGKKLTEAFPKTKIYVEEWGW